MAIAIVHLVRAANDFSHFERFIAAYEGCETGPPGNHRLILAFKGFDDRSIAPYMARIEGRPYHCLTLPDQGFDIGVYFLVAERIEASIFLFTSSFTLPRTLGWIDKLVQPLADPAIGVAGASGSWERIFPDQAWPNYHIRTTAFAIRRADFLSLRRPASFAEKADTNRFEAGPESMTLQFLARGMEPVVVDVDGTLWPKNTWPDSRTFRPSERAVAVDNRMQEHTSASPEVQAWLEDLAWRPDAEMMHPDKRKRASYRLKRLLRRLRPAHWAPSRPRTKSFR